MRFRFGALELDTDAGELRRDGAPVEIQPKPLALLALLLRERHRVVPSDEILATLWPDTTVTSGSLTRAVSHARRAIGDTHRGASIRSFARRGYRFCGDVLELARAQAPAAAARDAGALFVGRSDALQRLRTAWSEAVAGHGGLALVSGPPGIGKTRLAELFAAETGARGARVLIGRCRDGEGVPAFWLFAQVLRQLVATGAADAELRAAAARSEELCDLVPELGARPDPAPRTEPAPDQSRFLLFDAVTRALARAARERPLLLVLEDVQWAGSASLRLLEHLACESLDDPILVLATLRDEFRARGHPLSRTLAILGAQERCLSLELAGLPRRDVAALLEQVLGRPAPPDLTSELYGLTEGVPLFLREAIRLLELRGALAEPERVAREGVALPGRTLDLIRRSLDALGPRAAALVSAGAVLGREFAAPAAAELAEIPREDALDLLDEATRAGVVEADPDDAAGWRFRHALFREAAYEGLSAGARARLHLRAARRLERQHEADPERAIAELAHHHHRALAVGDPERAFACALRAAERATRLSAWEQAADHYEQAAAALEHAEAVDPERRLSLLLAHGEACRLSGERARRREVLAEAMASAGALGRPHEQARAAIGFCDLQEWGVRDDAARAAVEDALAALGPDPGVLRPRLLTRLAYFEIRSAHEEARAVARRALALARAAGDPEAVQDALYVLHFALGGPDALEERTRLAEEIAGAASRSQSSDRALIALLDTASDRLMQGDGDGARALRERAALLSGDKPSPTMRWHMGVYDTGMALLEGRFAEVPARVRDTLLLGQRVGHPYALACANGHRACLARDTGTPDEQLAVLEPALRAPEGPVHWIQAVVARARLAAGRKQDARALFESLAAREFEDVPRNLRWTATLVEIGGLCADLGDAGRARPLYALLERFASQHGVLPMAVCHGGPVSLVLARLAERLGRPDDAAPLYDEALAATRALGAAPALASVALHAGAFHVRGAPRRAAELLAESARSAAALGLAGIAAAAEAQLARVR